jgi:hypothetical protein
MGVKLQKSSAPSNVGADGTKPKEDLIITKARKNENTKELKVIEFRAF